MTQYLQAIPGDFSGILKLACWVGCQHVSFLLPQYYFMPISVGSDNS